ncbi:MAG: hypothetical protein KDC46_14555 [Thermoleophilia bacterium]|nr:hypothetical protein [Thermoleophilia bacterium]
MAIRSASDAFYVILARLPLILLFAGVMWVLLNGLIHLEAYSFGTEYFMGNDETTNQLPGLGGPSDSQVLSDALASGDVDQMEAALNRVEASGGGVQG